MSRTLLLSTLIEKGACLEQVALFRETFGESVRITPERCFSVADKFAWGWAAWRLLSPSARAEYERVRESAWVEGVRASAWVEHERVRASAWANAYIGDAS